MKHANTKLPSRPQDSNSKPIAASLTNIFKSRGKSVLYSNFEELTREKKRFVEHYTKSPYEALKLDIQNFEHFHITKLGAQGEQFHLPNGELVVPCEFEYQYSEDAIIKRSIEKWHYNLEDGNRTAKAYIKSKSGTHRSVALVTLPIAEATNLKFYSRSLGEAAEHIMPPLRNAVLVLWVEKIAKDSESTTGFVNSLFSKIMNG